MKHLVLDACECGHHLSEHLKGGKCTAFHHACPCAHFAPRMRVLKVDEQKQLVFAMLLPLCPYLRVNGVHPDVVMPADMRTHDLTFRVGEDPRGAYTEGLETTSQGLSAMLWVKGAQHNIFVPWEALDALFVREPFDGPIISWKERLEAPPTGTMRKPPHLRLLRSEPPPEVAKVEPEETKP